MCRVGRETLLYHTIDCSSGHHSSLGCTVTNQPDEMSWCLPVEFIKHNQNYYLKLDVLTSIRGLHQKRLVYLKLDVSTSIRGLHQKRLVYLKLDISTSIRGLHQKKLVLSSSSSWHNRNTPCQESGRLRGSVGSCPHHGSWPVVLPFGCVWPLWFIW